MTTPFPQGKNWGVEEVRLPPSAQPSAPAIRTATRVTLTPPPPPSLQDDDGNNGCTIEECRWILHNEDMGLYDKGKDAEEGFLSHLPDELKPDTPPLVRWVDGLQDGKAHQKRLFIGLHCIHLDKRIPSKEITDFIESMGYVKRESRP